MTEAEKAAEQSARRLPLCGEESWTAAEAMRNHRRLWRPLLIRPQSFDDLSVEFGYAAAGHRSNRTGSSRRWLNKVSAASIMSSRAAKDCHTIRDSCSTRWPNSAGSNPTTMYTGAGNPNAQHHQQDGGIPKRSILPATLMPAAELKMAWCAGMARQRQNNRCRKRKDARRGVGSGASREIARGGKIRRVEKLAVEKIKGTCRGKEEASAAARRQAEWTKVSELEHDIRSGRNLPVATEQKLQISQLTKSEAFTFFQRGSFGQACIKL